MRQPLLLASNEVQQQAVDAGLPPYAVAVVTGMLQPAGTLHTRYSARAETLYNSLEVDGAINKLLTSRFTQWIPLLIAPGVVREGGLGDEYRWISRDTTTDARVRELHARLQDLGLDVRWTGLGVASFTTTNKELIGFMEALGGFIED
nr:MAG TPA: hypothetical protein [Caudoviricetes sp.]